MNNDEQFKNQLILTSKSKKNVEKKILQLKNHNLTKIKNNFRYYKSDNNKNNSNYAYVTIIFGGIQYLPAILALGHSLRKTKTHNKLICLI